MKTEVILEGCDLVGKSTAVKLLDGMFPIRDRLMEFTEAVLPDSYNLQTIVNAVAANRDKFFIVLTIADDNLLLRRLALRTNADDYDRQCVAYNRAYINVVEELVKMHRNVIQLEVGGMNKFEKTAKIVEAYLRYTNPHIEERTV